MNDCQRLSGNILEQISSWAKKNFVPLNATFELTPFCNFRCVMCYVRLNKNEAERQGKMLSADEWLGIARQARDMGTLYVTLTGGEPFLHPEFWKIYEELNKMGFLISILSNGYHIDESAIEKFREFGMPFMIKLTLYGASDETYKRVCGSSDGFTKISKAVDLLVQEKVPLKMTSTIVRENAHDLQAIYAFAREKGIPMQHTVSVVRSSRNSENTTESSRFALSDFPEEITLEELEKSKFPPLESPFAWCASYGSSVWMTWHGHVQMCSFMGIPEIVYSGDLASDYIRLHRELEKIKNPSECAECEWQEFCQRCPGVLCSESGHPEKTDAGLCDMAKRLYELYTQRKGERI